jgi:hypothetical protein
MKATILVGVLFAVIVSSSGVSAQAIAPGTARVIGTRVMQSYKGSDGDVSEKIRQVYKLETADSFIEVTGYENVFKAHGRPAMEIGQLVTYSVDPKHAQYLKIVLSDGKEHKFLRVSSELKPQPN